MGNHIESGILESSAQLFGLELYQIEDDWEKAVKELLQRTKGRRPIIFAATIANARGRSDDFAAIGRLSPGYFQFSCMSMRHGLSILLLLYQNLLSENLASHA